MLQRRDFLMSLAMLPRLPKTIADPVEALVPPTTAQVVDVSKLTVRFQLHDIKQKSLLDKNLRMRVASPGLMTNVDEVVFGPVSKSCTVQAHCLFSVTGLPKNVGSSSVFFLTPGDSLKFAAGAVRVEYY